VERCFLNLKTERVWQRGYDNHDVARRNINHYIMGFYNTIRLHSTLRYLSSVVDDTKMTVKEAIYVSKEIGTLQRLRNRDYFSDFSAKAPVR
jgi:putative transposase